MWKRIYFLTIFLIYKISAEDFCQDSSSECFHGQPGSDGSCVCEVGWTGEKCQNCAGRIVLEDESGCISDGNNGFQRSVNCGWLIKRNPLYANRTLKLSISNDNSCEGIQLQIFDGEGEFSPLLASYSRPTALDSDLGGDVVATSGNAFLAFLVDGPVSLTGYNITYEYSSNSHEVDSEEIAAMTSLSAETNWDQYSWQSLTAQSRGSASFTVIDNFAYVYSGRILGDSDKREQMLRINLSNFTVQAIQVSSHPEPRFGHSTVAWQDSLLVYGGLKSTDYAITNEFWKFNVTSQTWDQLSLTGQLPPPLYGHTAHLVEMKSGEEMLIIIFGFHPDWRFSNFVFQIEIGDNMTLQRVETTGAIPPGAFGHASAHNPSTNQIFVLGGKEDDNYQQSDFYVFDVEGKTWTNLYPIPSRSRYFHSMVFMNDSLLVYGGRRADMTSCVVMPFETYDTGSGSWKDISHTDVQSHSRFGHAALVVNSQNQMLLYGGFNGIMHTTILSYTIDSDRSSCANLTEANCTLSPFCSFLNGNCTELNCTLTDSDCKNFCGRYARCTDCLSAFSPCCQCQYSSDCNLCSNGEENGCNETISEIRNCPSNQTLDYQCNSLKTCSACHQVDFCYWGGTSCIHGTADPSSCPTSVLEYASCMNCTSHSHTWCETTNTCLRNAELSVLYPYGSCTDIRTSTSDCSDLCSVHSNCDDCTGTDLTCGWCSEDDNTGLGSCMSGTFIAPFNSTCNGNWSYQECPDCQCNGHSTCVDENVCNDCETGISGDTCGVCADGFYGNPINGGNCSQCQCNGNADTCGSTGVCDCNVYGVTGEHCELCSSRVSGDAVNSSCFYHLDTGFRYQFALGSTLSRMNFAICTSSSADLLVTIDSGSGAVLDEDFNVTFTFNHSRSKNETVIATAENTAYAQLTVQNSLVHFPEQNCVHIYLEFEPSFTFFIQLEEVPFDIVLLIAIVAAVFLVLLIAVAIFWKLHSVWFRYRQRIQHQVELQVMATRPYARINFDFSGIFQSEKNPTHFTKQAVVVGGAAVGSVLLWVPNGGGSNEREPMLAVGTALVTSKHTPNVKSMRVRPSRRVRQSRSSSGFDNPVLDMQDVERNNG